MNQPAITDDQATSCQLSPTGVLDAALGFCVGCWIYSRLFNCRACKQG